MDGTSTEALLAERGKTHGDFGDHARIAQDLKVIVREENDLRPGRNQLMLTHAQLESLEMICHKIGRILAGNADYHDHWDDIAGYAKLCSKPPASDDGSSEDLAMKMFGPPAFDKLMKKLQNLLDSSYDEFPTQEDIDIYADRNSPNMQDHPAFGEGGETPGDDGSLADLAVEMFGPNPFDDETLTSTFGPVEDYEPSPALRDLLRQPAPWEADTAPCANLGKDHPAIREGDETTAGNQPSVAPRDWSENYAPTKCDHKWMTVGCPVNIKRCKECGQEQHIMSPPKVEKHPCDCLTARLCTVEHGYLLGNGTYCSKAEEG